MSDSNPAALSQLCFVAASDNATPIQLIESSTFSTWRATLTTAQQAWLARQDFHGRSGQWAWLESSDTGDSATDDQVIVGWDGQDNLATLGSLAHSLPEGEYCLAQPVSDQQLLGWSLGAYRFNRYKSPNRQPARLVIPEANQADKIVNTTTAVALSRDLINTGAGDMTPGHLAAEAEALAEQFDASIRVAHGDELLDIDCGAIHAVGRAATAPPCLIDLTWGDPDAPQVVLIGKGITFDSGGLNLKPTGGIRWMKKDMGGAATALGLAYLIMAQALPIHLRLLIPAAENAIAGNAFRPGDILSTHKGLTVEIDNTDAEGRLVLCDALSIACADKPELIFDFATLTGSARSAVGTESAAMFCNDDELAHTLGEAGAITGDNLWRMPLHPGYNHMLDSKVADLVNSAASPYAGAITAALFLQRFVDADSPTRWTHFDIMAFNNRSRPGHPEGGEAMGLRAVYHYLEEQFG
ncbi:MAG: leucyl aminopeptidase family protein [Pseudomonadota bacterium]